MLEVNNLRTRIAQEAMSLVGQHGRNHPGNNEDHTIGRSPETGFDCSGLILYIFGMVGLTIPNDLRHTSELFDHFGIFAHQGREGDLVFFSKEGLAPKHVGIMVSNREYVHRKGDTVEIAELKVTKIPIRRQNQLYRLNPIGFKILSIQNGRWKTIVE